jgi:hypothetical protein
MLSGSADAQLEDVLCRVDIDVEDAAAIGADEAGPTDATCRIDGAAGVAELNFSL